MNSLGTEISKIAQDKFSAFELSFIEVKYQGNVPVFIARLRDNDEQKLQAGWQELVNFLAFNFQSQLTDKFSIWNLYIFFVSRELINSDLKYKIENDTFSSRKIVIEEDVSTEEIVAQHITNVDVNFNIENSSLETSLVLDNVIGKYVSSSTTTKRLTEDHRIALKNIIKDLRESGKK